MIETVKSLTKAAVSDRKGATAVEYAVIAAAITVVCIAGFQLIGTNLQAILQRIAGALT